MEKSHITDQSRPGTNGAFVDDAAPHGQGCLCHRPRLSQADPGFRLEPAAASEGPGRVARLGRRVAGRGLGRCRKGRCGKPRVALHCRDIGSGYLDGAHGPQSYISAATMGRLFIPRLIDGYVLYIDGDTLVTGDVSELFRLDLGRAYAGVVRDYTVAHWLSDQGGRSGLREERLSEIRQLMDPAPVQDYFNAGVLLLNCDALRAEPALLERVADVLAASACSHGDQDHLNALFRGNVVQLDLGWNASWGRIRKHRAHLSRNGTPATGALPGRGSVILHYHGPEKPWRATGWDIWSSRGRATRIYKRALRRFLRRYPDLRPT
ncbi:MAG: glycosyltransferase [Paracoccus aminovorans]|nr:glycosyltransferase [Paracoccus aminovorans]